MKSAIIVLGIYMAFLVYFFISRDIFFAGGSVQVPVGGFGIVFKTSSLVFYLISIGLFLFSFTCALANRFRLKWLNLFLILSVVMLGLTILNYMTVI